MALKHYRLKKLPGNLGGCPGENEGERKLQSQNQKKANVLIVDDEPANLDALEQVLCDLDAALVRADSGREALKAMMDREFAVILMDVRARPRVRRHVADAGIVFLHAVELDGRDGDEVIACTRDGRVVAVECPALPAAPPSE